MVSEIQALLFCCECPLTIQTQCALSQNTSHLHCGFFLNCVLCTAKALDTCVESYQGSTLRILLSINNQVKFWLRTLFTANETLLVPKALRHTWFSKVIMWKIFPGHLHRDIYAQNLLGLLPKQIMLGTMCWIAIPFSQSQGGQKYKTVFNSIKTAVFVLPVCSIPGCHSLSLCILYI